MFVLFFYVFQSHIIEQFTIYDDLNSAFELPANLLLCNTDLFSQKSQRKQKSVSDRVCGKAGQKRSKRKRKRSVSNTVGTSKSKRVRTNIQSSANHFTTSTEITEVENTLPQAESTITVQKNM